MVSSMPARDHRQTSQYIDDPGLYVDARHFAISFFRRWQLAHGRSGKTSRAGRKIPVQDMRAVPGYDAFAAQERLECPRCGTPDR
jgi:hypothetical protein